MKRKLLTILTICTLAFSLAACGESKEAANIANNTSEAEVSSEEANAEENSEATNAESSEAEENSEAESTETSEDAAKGYSSSVANGLIIELPEGFTKSEEESTDTIEYFYGPNYPNETANININVTANDGSLAFTTTDMLVMTLEPQLEAAYQIDLDIKVTKNMSPKIDDHRALIYAIEYALTDEVSLTQQQCIIENNDKLVFVTFTSATGEDYADAYDACIDSIRFE